jgi:cell division protein FtsI (penicillin-binding protein 3)
VHIDLQVPSEDLFRSEYKNLADSLASLIGKRSSQGYQELLRQGRASGNRYLSIAKNINYLDMQRLKKFPILNKGRYRGGVIYQVNMIRKKPYQQLASRTIGYSREDLKVGLEAGFNEYLEGATGKRLETKLAGGIWRPVDENSEFDPEDGKDIITTIDINLQDVAETALKNQLIQYNAHHGTVIVMEVKTGYIKAIANLNRNKNGNYIEGFNYAIGEATEPGSTFKLPVLMAALEDGFVSINDSVDTQNGTMKYYDRIMRDSKEGGYGTISVQRAFELSSNVGISKVITEAYQKDPQKLVNRLKMMGLGSMLDVEIPGEAKPRIKNVEDQDWTGVTMPWMSIGYEVLQTPMQTLTFYNAVANNGKMMKPQFVKEIRKNGLPFKKFAPIVLNNSIASSSTIKKAQFLLDGVVSRDGTAKNLDNHELKIAGKTGTAQIALGIGGYKKERKYLASFAGYFPVEEPEYSCIVVVYAPSGGIYGNIVAGPIFREIADKIYATNFNLQSDEFPTELAAYKVPVSKEGYMQDAIEVFEYLSLPYELKSSDAIWIRTETQPEKIVVSELNMIENLIPNVKGMGAMDAIYLLENAGLKVKIEGSGVVKQMSIQPGERIIKGSEITLNLESA